MHYNLYTSGMKYNTDSWDMGQKTSAISLENKISTSNP